jgi:hypothetical protein
LKGLPSLCPIGGNPSILPFASAPSYWAALVFHLLETQIGGGYTSKSPLRSSDDPDQSNASQ